MEKVSFDYSEGLPKGTNLKLTKLVLGDQEPELEPGDIIIVLEEKEHPLFKRNGSDLVLRLEIQLVEALCGFQKAIRTLDDRDLVITQLPGEVIKHGDLKCIQNEGNSHSILIFFCNMLNMGKYFRYATLQEPVRKGSSHRYILGAIPKNDSAGSYSRARKLLAAS